MVDLHNNNSPFNVYVSKICPSGLIFEGGIYMGEGGLYLGFFFFCFFQSGFTPCKAEQPLRGMELQEKKQKRLQDT